MNESERLQELIILRGLPGSGKTTYANKWVQEDPDFRVRVNRDDIRHQLFNKYWGLTRHQEETVSTMEHAQCTAALRAGHSVIIDATGFAAQSMREWFSTADKLKVPATVVDIETPVEQCIKQDQTRLKFVGEPVIRDFAKRYLTKGKFPALPDRLPTEAATGALYTQDETKQPIYLFDIDGTLARMHGRSPFAWHRVGEDKPIHDVIRVARILSGHARLVVMSGRDEVCRPETEKWLGEHGVPFLELHMRPEGTSHPDDVMKLELFDRHIRNNYNVLGVFDDRLRVCRAWESIGLTLFRVGPIDASF